MLVKAEFVQSELGMRAGKLSRSRRPSHKMNKGIKAALRTSRVILVDLRIFDMSLVSVLHNGE